MRHSSAFAALLDEAVGGLWRARRMVLLSVFQIAVSIYLVGVFLLFAENMNGVTETVRNESAVTVFLKPATPETEKQAVEEMARKSHFVENMRRVSKDDARKRFLSSWHSLARAADTIDTNPFPETIEIDLMHDAVSSPSLPGFLERLSQNPGVDDVQFDVEWIRRLRGIVTLVQTAGGFLGLVLAFGTAFTIANVVRLTILLHQDEIEILRLVGAPELLIRGPFVLGAIVQGFLGGILAVLLLAGSFHSVIEFVERTQNAFLGVFVVRFVPPLAWGGLILGGAFAGLFGGLAAVRRKNMHT